MKRRRWGRGSSTIKPAKLLTPEARYQPPKLGSDIHDEEHCVMSDIPNTGSTPLPFYCDMTALTPDERSTHQGRISQLFGSLVRETRELTDGFAYRFDGEHYLLLASFISDERKCCPFLTFRLEVAPERGPIWLQLTAQGGVRPFLVEELGHFGATH
jgi:hypothetical protein